MKWKVITHQLAVIIHPDDKERIGDGRSGCWYYGIFSINDKKTKTLSWKHEDDLDIAK